MRKNKEHTKNQKIQLNRQRQHERQGELVLESWICQRQDLNAA